MLCSACGAGIPIMLAAHILGHLQVSHEDSACCFVQLASHHDLGVGRHRGQSRFSKARWQCQAEIAPCSACSHGEVRARE